MPIPLSDAESEAAAERARAARQFPGVGEASPARQAEHHAGLVLGARRESVANSLFSPRLRAERLQKKLRAIRR